RFGRSIAVVEASRDAGALVWVDALRQDVRYALRTLGRAPGFTAAAVLTLALGIGANTTMFSVMNGTLRQPVPFPEAERLETVWKVRVGDPETLNITSLPNYRDWRDRTHTFESLALFDSAGRGYNLTGPGGDNEAEQVPGLRVTASFFTVLGVPPLLGRTFVPDEETPGRDRVVVLSHSLWLRRYGGDGSIVGKTIQIDSKGFTVVGVMPPAFRFRFGVERQLWVPAGWTKGDEERGSNSFIVIGRLKRGVTLEQARGDMDTIGRALAAEYPDPNEGQTVRIVPMSELGESRLRSTLVPMLGIVGFVLLIACANVANLLLARAASRGRELAVRSALGAGRGRIMRQLLTESVVLACAGGAAGLVLAYWTIGALTPILPANVSSLPFRAVQPIAIDASVLAFTAAAALGSGILFGLAPAFAHAGAPSGTLRDGARGLVGDGRSRLRYGLVAAEVALTLVVLAGAGVMLVSVAKLLRVDPGLDTTNVLVLQMSLPQENLYYGPPGNPRFCEALGDQVGALPGVVSVSAIAHLPLSGANAGRGLAIEGRPDPGPQNQPGAVYSVACPDLIKTMGMTLKAGRDFTVKDTLGAPDVALINDAFARRHWPGEDAVGKRFKIGRAGSDAPWLTVVGVFKDIRYVNLDTIQGPFFLRPYQQAGWPVMSIVVKTAAAPQTFAAPVKRALASIEPTQPVSAVRTMDEVVGRSMASRRFPMLLLSSFAALALVLAGIGIAGVVGYSVVQRTPEIGVRIALGAQRRDVLRLVLGQSLGWIVCGVAVGIVGAVALLRWLGSMLYGVTAGDPWVLGTVSLILIGVALAASYVPARRAVRVDAVNALRQN
ncbi:MAG TPA: ABC transporter permease, partial [Vicinamibacterales bacterium]